MEQLGIDFNATGSVMSKDELEELRRKRGECISCGRKCYQKRLFKMIPITDHGRVLNGRCLGCKPLHASESEGGLIPAAARPATREDLARFSRSQSGLGQQGSSSPQVAAVTRPSAGGSTTRRAQSGRSFSGSDGPRSSPAVRTPNRSQSLGGLGASAAAAVAVEAASNSQDFGRDSAHSSHSIVSAERPPQREASREPDNSSGSYEGQPRPDRARPGMEQNSQYTSASARDLRPQHRNPGLDTQSVHSCVDQRRPSLGSDPYNEETRSLHPPLDRYADGRDGEHQLQNAINRVAGVYIDNGLPPAGHAGDGNHYPPPPEEAGYYRQTSSQSQISLNSRELDPEDRHSREASPLGEPRHGTLNRGGEMAFKSDGGVPTTSHSGSGRHLGSSRTLSSINSLEDDHHRVNGRGNHQQRFVPQNDAVYEEEVAYDVGNRQLSSDDEAAIDRLHAANGNCAEILDVMRESKSPLVQSFGLKEISCLRLTLEDQDRLAHCGAMHLMTDAMRSDPMDIELQIHGCMAIWNGSGTPENQRAFVQAGALNIILSNMDKFIDNAEVQECAMGTLSNLAAAEENLAVMIDSGAVQRVVEAMNKHSENGLVQAKGCSAITNMASHLSPMKKDIMRLGGGGAVVVCMVMHPDDFDLQEKALRALKNLSSNSDENKMELANIGGIDAVITAMQVHRDQAGVQEAGAWTLSNLASNIDNKAVIGDCGGIDVIIRAMWVHSDNVHVQEWCCRALYTLTLDRQNSAMVLQVGGISAVVNAMQAHIDSPAVQEMGCAVLCNLAFDEPSKMRIVDEEALDAIVLAMVLFTDDGKVQESACEVLLQLAIVENFKSMQASNIGELARGAASKFPENCKEPAYKLLQILEGYIGQY